MLFLRKINRSCDVNIDFDTFKTKLQNHFINNRDDIKFEIMDKKIKLFRIVRFKRAFYPVIEIEEVQNTNKISIKSRPNIVGEIINGLFLGYGLLYSTYEFLVSEKSLFIYFIVYLLVFTFAYLLLCRINFLFVENDIDIIDLEINKLVVKINSQ